MKSLMFAILFTSAVGCNSGMQEVHKTDACQSYYDFIREQWIKKEGFYQFKEKPEYLEDTQEAVEIRKKYFNEPCLIGLPKRIIQKIFGSPNKEMISEESENQLYTYCLNERCNENFDIVFTNGLVIMAYPNPIGIYKSHN